MYAGGNVQGNSCCGASPCVFLIRWEGFILLRVWRFRIRHPRREGGASPMPAKIFPIPNSEFRIDIY